MKHAKQGFIWIQIRETNANLALHSVVLFVLQLTIVVNAFLALNQAERTVAKLVRQLIVKTVTMTYVQFVKMAIF